MCLPVREGGKARGSKGGKGGGHQLKMVESLMNTTTVCIPASSVKGGGGFGRGHAL